MLTGFQTRLTTWRIGCQASQIASGADFTAKTGLTLNALYSLSEGSGNALDSVGSNHLSAVGTIGYRSPAGNGFGQHFQSVSAGQRAAVNDPGLNSFIFGAVAVHSTAPTSGQPGIVGRISNTSFPCAFIYKASDTLNYPVLLIRDATSTALISVVSANINTGEPVLYVGKVNRAANTAEIIVATPNKVLGTNQASIAGFGTLSGGTSPVFQVGGGSTLIGGARVTDAFISIGAATESKNIVTLCKEIGYGG